MLYLTIAEVAKAGPADFNSQAICDRLGITYPMVNHYFGSRNGMISEAGFAIYELYISRLWENVEAARSTPEARLRAWLQAQVALHIELGGWGKVLNYPHYWQGILAQMEQEKADRRKQLFEVNIARLAMLVRDYRNQEVTAVEFTPENYPREDLLLDKKLIELTTTIALSTLGLAVWRSGGHIPSKGIVDLQEMTDVISENHQRQMLAIAIS